MTKLRTAKRKGDFETLFTLYLAQADSKQIKDCLAYMREMHDLSPTFMRMEGIPYWVHPVEVWYSLLMLDPGASKEEQIAALLHDIDEDTSGTIKEIENLFDANAAAMVHDLSHSTIPNYDSLEKEYRRTLYWDRLDKSSLETKTIKALDRANNLASSITLLVNDPKRYKKFVHKQTAETETFLLPILRRNYSLGKYPHSLNKLVAVCRQLETTCDLLNRMLDAIDPRLGDLE